VEQSWIPVMIQAKFWCNKVGSLNAASLIIDGIAHNTTGTVFLPEEQKKTTDNASICSVQNIMKQHEVTGTAISL
jgi:hypothetical protein